MQIPLPEDKPTISLIEAGHAWGIAREKSYELARRGAFPVPVLRLGAKWRVRTCDVRRALGLDEQRGAAAS